MKHLFTSILILLSQWLISQNDTTYSDTVPTQSPKDYYYAKESSCFLKGSVAFGNAYRGIMGSKYEELIDCRNEHESSINVPEGGVDFGYRFTNWLSIGAGLHFLETGFDFREDRSLSDTLPMEFVVGCDVYNVVNASAGYVGAGFFDPRLNTAIVGLHPSSATLDIQVRYYYLNLPIQAELTGSILYGRSSGRLQVFVNGGLAPNYMVKQKFSHSFSNGNWNVSVDDSIGTPIFCMQRWNIGALFGGGFSVHVNEKILVRAEFNTQFQLRNIFNEKLSAHTNYIEKHNVYRLGLGVCYNL